jgi:D-sedoheptulose 7-phosphate isomerase
VDQSPARPGETTRSEAAPEAGIARLRAAAGSFLDEAAGVLRAVAAAEAGRVAQVAAMLAERMRRGRALYTCGNGGSAADAQHVAAELAGKFYVVRPGLAALALTTNTSALTAIANDFSFDDVFVRQLEGLARPGDVLMAFTTSGRSANVRRAVEWARGHGLATVALVGEAGREWARSCDHAFVVPSTVTPHIQQAHITLGHAVCALTEAELFPGAGPGATGGADAAGPASP